LAVLARPKILEHIVYLFHLSPDRLVPLLWQNFSRFEINDPNTFSVRCNYDTVSTHITVNYTTGMGGLVGLADLPFNMK